MYNTPGITPVGITISRNSIKLLVPKSNQFLIKYPIITPIVTLTTNITHFFTLSLNKITGIILFFLYGLCDENNKFIANNIKDNIGIKIKKIVRLVILYILFN
jgi:hypothetical protein